jgi:hypothetical protein
MMTPNLAAALELVGAGFRVFGCYPDKKKRPVRRLSWQKSACVQPVQVMNYWRHYGPDLMPAIDVGPSGLFVVDLDVGHEDGVDGIAAFGALCERYGDVPLETPIVRTPSDGLHLFFKQPSWREPLGNGEGALPDGINVRGVGGYVIGLGAVRCDEGTFYDALPGTPCLLEAFKAGSIPEVPAWLVEIIDTAPERPDVQERCPLPAGPAPVCSDARGREYALAALDGCRAELAGMAKNSGRNNTLNAVAFKLGRMAARGWLTEAETLATLWDACMANGLVKEDGRRQCLATFNNGFGDGMRNPAQDPRERYPVNPGFTINLKLKHTHLQGI